MWPEGSYEVVAVRPSILPSFCPEVFLGLAYSFFFETQHGVRGACGVMHDRQIFWKNFFVPKREKMTKKWAKNRVF